MYAKIIIPRFSFDLKDATSRTLTKILSGQIKIS
jgi:hypothetical protein